MMRQEQIDELVERFYAHLTQDAYYSAMFAERKVDIALLKERQRAFIARLANPEKIEDGHGEVRQVQERHHFGVDPRRAETWMALMKKTMEEMELEPDVMEPLLEKIQFLMGKMVKAE